MGWMGAMVVSLFVPVTCLFCSRADVALCSAAGRCVAIKPNLCHSSCCRYPFQPDFLRYVSTKICNTGKAVWDSRLLTCRTVLACHSDGMALKIGQLL